MRTTNPIRYEPMFLCSVRFLFRITLLVTPIFSILQDLAVKKSFPPVPESGEVPEDEDFDEDVDDDEESGDESTRIASEEENEEYEDEESNAFVVSHRRGYSDTFGDTASSGSGGKDDAEEEEARADPEPPARKKRSLVFVDSEEEFSM